MRRMLFKVLTFITALCAFSAAFAAAGCDEEGTAGTTTPNRPQELVFSGKDVAVTTVSQYYLDSDGYKDGTVDEEKAFTQAEFFTGETYYCVLDFTFYANEGAENPELLVGLEIYPASSLSATLETADSGEFTQTEVNDRLRVSVAYALTDDAEGFFGQVVIKIKPTKNEYAQYSYGFAEKGDDPFAMTQSTALTIDYGEDDYTEGLEYALAEDGLSYVLTGIGEAVDRSVKVPAKLGGLPVTEVADEAFKDNMRLTRINLPASVTRIGESAFAGCKGLERVTLHAGLAGMGAHAFEGCICLESITLPETLKTVSEYAFNDCTALASAVLEFGVERIGGYAFANCRGLKDVSLPLGMTAIERYAFNSCASLAGIALPSSICEIGEFAFASSGLESVTLPGSLTAVANNTFGACTKLKSVSVPASVIEIEEQAFYNCKALTNVELAHGLNVIGEIAFYNCTSLKSITIPRSVYSIGKEAFFTTGLTTAEFLQPNGWMYDGSENYLVVSDKTTAANILKKGEALYR